MSEVKKNNHVNELRLLYTYAITIGYFSNCDFYLVYKFVYNRIINHRHTKHSICDTLRIFFSLNKSCMTPENFMFWMKREKKLLYITTNKCMSIKERIRNGASAYHKWLFINS